MKIEPTKEQLKKDVRYECGCLFWLPRGNGKFDKQFSGKKVGCVQTLPKQNNRKVIMSSYRGKNYLVHRLIWILHNGTIPQEMEIDHINNNSLDNNISNLRLATSKQNSYNAPIRKDNTSGVKGVFWNKATRNWRARIFVDGKAIQVGMFNSLEEAKKEITLARKNYHGNFANNGITE